MGSKGSNTTTQTQSYAANPYVSGAGQQAIQMAQGAVSQPFQTPAQPVAGFSGDQQSAFQGARDAYMSAQPYLDMGANYTSQSAAPITGDQVNNYLNPMADYVRKNLAETFGNQMRQTTGQLTQAAGGLGASRIGVGQAELARQQGLAAGQTYANLYQPALAAAQADKQRQANAGYAFAAMGPAAQAARLQGAGALLNTGGLQQQYDQALLDSGYQQDLARIAYPYQNAQFLSGITAQQSPVMGGTTTGTVTRPAPSIWSQIAGAGLAGLGIYSGLGGAGGIGKMFSGLGKGGGAPSYTDFGTGQGAWPMFGRASGGGVTGGTPDFGSEDLIFMDRIPGMPLAYADPRQKIPMGPFAPEPNNIINTQHDNPALTPFTPRQPIDTINEGFAEPRLNPFEITRPTPSHRLNQVFKDANAAVDDGSGILQGGPTDFANRKFEASPFVGPMPEPDGEAHRPAASQPATQFGMYGARPRRAVDEVDVGSDIKEPYPDAPYNDDAGSRFARSPALALTAAGLGIMGGDSPYAGINIGKGGLEGVKVLDQQRARAREEVNANLAAKRLVQEAKLTQARLADANRTRDETERHNRAMEKVLADRVRAAEEKSSKAKPLTDGAIKALEKVGSTYEDFNRLANTWYDDFGGYAFEWTGDMANWLGSRNRAGLKEQSDWWSGYQEQKNLVRNSLFGSALTRTERDEFDKASINPGMAPEIIRERLARQASAAARAAKKIGQARIASGNDSEAVGAALGFDPNTIETRIVVHPRTMKSKTDPGLEEELRKRNAFPGAP